MPPSPAPRPLAHLAIAEHDVTLAGAVASFFRDDARRLLAVAAALRGSRPTIEARVRGGSMGNVLPHGAPVRLRLGDNGSHRAGDIVVFLADGVPCVHRIVHCVRRRGAQGYVITQGDAIAVPDRPVAAPAILGQVTAVLRKGQWTPPAEAEARPFVARWTARLLRAIVVASAEIDVRLAERSVAVIATLRLVLGRPPLAGRAARFLIRALAARRGPRPGPA